MLSFADLVGRVTGIADGGGRGIVAIAGPPGAGKSTVAERLCDAIQADGSAHHAIMVPMDGFHLDNRILDQRGIRDRKGAPQTFDVAGYRHMIERIRRGDHPVTAPLFDRTLDMARAGAIVIEPHHDIILTEGNYLLLGQQPWAGLQALFDLTIFVDVAMPGLESRLVQRWLDHGFTPAQARRRAHDNDLVNARLVLEDSIEPDVRFRNDDGNGVPETRNP